MTTDPQPQASTAPTEQRPRCGWKCGDDRPGHAHYTVIVRENGRLLGRITPDGRTTTRKVFAAILSRSRAHDIASDINAGGQFTARATPF